MICIQDDMCYNNGEEIAPILDIREKLKDVILILSDEQAEYVLRRLQCYLQEKKSNA